MVQPLLDAVVKVGVGARVIVGVAITSVSVEEPLTGETLAVEQAVGKYRQSNATNANRGVFINHLE